MGAGLNTQQPPLPPGQRPVPPPLDFKTGRPVQTPKPLPKPLPISKGGKPIFAPLPDKKTSGPAPRSPIDMVRDLGFGSAMANQDYENRMREAFARLAAERGTPTPPSGPLGGPVGSPRSKRDPSKEIILNFAGGEYGIRNDAAANEIAKKYNLEIVRNPDQKSALPNYIFKSNGNVNDIISQIKNEPGIGYAEQNFVIPPPSVGGKPQPSQPRPSSPQRDPNTGMTFQEMMARQNQPLPPEQAPFTPRPQLPQEVRDAIEGRNAAQNQFTQGRLMGAPVNQSLQPGSALYQDLANQQMQEYQNSLQQSQQGTFESQYQNLANQQMQNYNNLLQQGIQRSNTMNQDAATNFANMQAGAPTTQPTIPLPQLRGVTAQPRNLPRPRQPKGFGSPIGRSAF